ncbi:LVIVD repeat-containing protein [Halosimplex amylolyticum]|uniref:LVIVD repeat-containing protein n=1 Tax=Halosimplex amylolyticum TaxID=3396616 RepID=UPI003F5753E0
MNRRQYLQTVAMSVPAASGIAPGVAAARADYEPLGSVSVSGATEAVVGPDARTAYVATQDGFAVVDVSDPASPAVVDRRTALLADREGGPLREILDVSVAGDRLLVAGPANHHDEPALEGFLLYDLANPTDPERVAFYETDFAIHNAFLAGDHAYLADTGRVVVVDVTGTPAEVGSWRPRDADPAWADVHPLLCFAHDMFVRGDRAYVVEWDAGTFVLDVSDPTAPTAVTRIGGRSAETLASIPDDEVVAHSLGMPGNHHTAMVNEDASLLVLNKEAWQTDLTEEAGVDPLGEVELWDLRDESSPAHLATIEAPESRDPEKSALNTTPHNFDVAGDRLFTSWYDGGVKVHDVSDPANPELLAWWRAPSRWTFWTAQRATDAFFVASSHARGRYNAGKGALVTFPNRPGEQQSPPPLTATPTPADPTPQGSPSPTPASTVTTASGTGAPPTDGTASTTVAAASGTTTGDGSGFGLLAALGAVGIAAWRRGLRE